ncbi:aldo/keto reductase family protein [Hirsutella rhossiliensis]|uniref:Aldo/keto reductase family domain-containing protein n=1 Tax=Hirsutella rhossiliensis TaxID=111463 RepID=A0A9P8MPS9_9HYPO|nr:aldo/keto reductase family domain-containing protein [Hirsutella rhossiliensis]KAH0959207.1 aldo/keto reductase family domain-containing protein [Hirsutella rhossiliensis]
MPQIIGKEVGPVGFGLMGFTWRPEPPPLEQALDALKAAVDSGCTLWNGAEFYGTQQYNTMTLLNKYFTKYPGDADKVTLIIKGGMDLATHAPDGSPEGVRRSLDNILKQLDGKKKLDLFSYSRRDHKVPLDVTYGTIQKDVETIHEATKHAKIWAAEVELSMFSPDILRNGVVAACTEHGIPITAYAPIGRGMLTGRFKNVEQIKDRGVMASFPRFQPDAFNHNLRLVNQVETLAKEKKCSPAQLAIAWVRYQGNRAGKPTIVPIPGATAVSRVEENGQAVMLEEIEVAKIDKIVDSFETAGQRYPSSLPMEQ